MKSAFLGNSGCRRSKGMRPVDRGKVPVPERRLIGISLSGWDSGDGQWRSGWKGSVPGLEGAKGRDAQRGTRAERRRATEVSSKLFYPGGWAEPPTEEEEELLAAAAAAAAITSQAGKSCSFLGSDRRSARIALATGRWRKLEGIMRRLGCLGDEYVGSGEGSGSNWGGVGGRERGSGVRRREALREGPKGSAPGCRRDPWTGCRVLGLLCHRLREGPEASLSPMCSTMTTRSCGSLGNNMEVGFAIRFPAMFVRPVPVQCSSLVVSPVLFYPSRNHRDDRA